MKWASCASPPAPSPTRSSSIPRSPSPAPTPPPASCPATPTASRRSASPPPPISTSSRRARIISLRTRTFDLGAEHELGRLRLDYGGAFSATHINNGFGNDGGQFTMRVNNLGWILDRTQSDLYPRLHPDRRRRHHQARELPPQRLLPKQQRRQRPRGPRSARQSEIRRPRAPHVFQDRRPLARAVRPRREPQPPLELPRHHAPVRPVDPQCHRPPNRPHRPVLGRLTILRRPQPDHAFPLERGPLFRPAKPVHRHPPRHRAVTAGYVMAQGRIGRTGVLTGVRVEETDTNSWGWVRARVPSTAAQQVADPVGSAQRDYGNTRRRSVAATRSPSPASISRRTFRPTGKPASAGPRASAAPR
jgi:hypothetical protein